MKLAVMKLAVMKLTVMKLTVTVGGRWSCWLSRSRPANVVGTLSAHPPGFTIRPATTSAATSPTSASASLRAPEAVTATTTG